MESKYLIQNPIRKDGKVIYDCIKFGSYPQSDATGQKKDPIKWRVLSVNGDDAFLVADQNLDVQRYHENMEPVTWENCTLRSWLNGYADYSSDNFIDRAFTHEEKAAIIPTKVANANNLTFGIEGGNDTMDKIYLLSYDEVTDPAYGFSPNHYVSDHARQRTNTAYTAAGGEIRSQFMRLKGKTDVWWLRSPGNYSYSAMDVSIYGYVYQVGYDVDRNDNAVCPALHLNLASNVWTIASQCGFTLLKDGKYEYQSSYKTVLEDHRMEYGGIEEIKQLQEELDHRTEVENETIKLMSKLQYKEAMKLLSTI